METWQIVLGLAGSSVITVLVTNFFSRRKTKAETEQIEGNITKTNVDSAITIVNAWKELNAENKADIAENKRKIEVIEGALKKAITDHKDCEERILKLERKA
jgi:hypothetical protein